MTAGSLLAVRAVNLVVCIEEKEMGKIRVCREALQFQVAGPERGNSDVLFLMNSPQTAIHGARVAISIV